MRQPDEADLSYVRLAARLASPHLSLYHGTADDTVPTAHVHLQLNNDLGEVAREILAA